MSQELVLRAAAMSILRTYDKGREVLPFRDRTSDVFFVIEGRVQIRNFSESGREFIYSEFGKGDVFGEFSALDGLPRSASVVAIDDSTVARMKSIDLLELLRSDFDLTLRLLRLLTAKVRELSDKVIELVALSACDRLRFELSRLAAKGVRQGAGIVIRPAPTHYELAARVGSQREAVTKELNRLATLGYLRLGRQQIVIPDFDRFSNDLIGHQDDAGPAS
jgi:CRP-like cAMP-binding protein